MFKDKEKTRVTVSVPPALLNDLDEIVKDQIYTRTQFILIALKEKIEIEKARKEMISSR